MRQHVHILSCFLFLAVFSLGTASCDYIRQKQDTLKDSLRETLIESLEDDYEEVEVVEEPTKPVRNNEYYQKMLEDFCKQYFNKKFAKRHYVYGSLRVNGKQDLSDNIVDVWGTLTYTGRSPFNKEYDNRDFKAMIREEAPGQFVIKFEKKTELNIPLISNSYWESIEAPFTYNPEQ